MYALGNNGRIIVATKSDCPFRVLFPRCRTTIDGFSTKYIIATINRCPNRCSAQVSVLRMNAAGREESTSKKSHVLKSNCLVVNSKQETAFEIHEACEEFDSRNLPPDPMASYSGPQTPSGLLKRIRQPRGNTFSRVSWNACIFWSTRTFPVSKSEFLEMPMNDRFLYSGQSNPLANQ